MSDRHPKTPKIDVTDPSLFRNKVTVEEQVTDVSVALVGVQGSVGPTGPLGPTGPIGPQGISGEGFLTGNGPPGSDDGVPGDLYFDVVDKNFWGPKTELGWPDEPFFSSQIKSRYVHTQQIASDTWLITHPLGGYPSITIVDSASSVVLGDVSYLSTTQVQVSFAAPFSGFAYLT